MYAPATVYHTNQPHTGRPPTTTTTTSMSAVGMSFLPSGSTTTAIPLTAAAVPLTAPTSGFVPSMNQASHTHPNYAYGHQPATRLVPTALPTPAQTTTRMSDAAAVR